MSSIRRLWCVVVFACLAGISFAQQSDEIDFAKARQLRQKLAAGEQLTTEERAYLERAIQARRGGARPAGSPAVQGAARSPLLLWGPYLWANGEMGRGNDDLVWRREDLVGDGTHPSPSGRQKVAEQLLRFFETDPTAKSWYSK